MTYFYLLSGGILVSVVHFLLVWPNRSGEEFSISEHAIRNKKTHLIYLLTHVITEALFLKFSHQFFVVENGLYIPHYLNIAFVVLDLVQAIFPSRGSTERLHWRAAYFSWLSYLFAGLVALFQLDLVLIYAVVGVFLLVPIVGMFIYMHTHQEKLYPYQLMVVPLFLLYMVVLVSGTK